MQTKTKRFGSIRKLCEVCGVEFRTTPKAHARGHGRFCNRSCSTIARHEGLIRSPRNGKTGQGNAYTAAEDEFIKKHYGKGATWISKRLSGRSKDSVQSRAARLGLVGVYKKVKAWTPEEDEWLRDHYSEMSISALSKHLERTKTAVRLRAKRLETRRMDSDNMSASEVALIFGVDRGTPVRWIERGMLKGKKCEHRGSKGTWEIGVKAVRKFILDFPHAFELVKVDRISFFDVLSGRAW